MKLAVLQDKIAKSISIATRFVSPKAQLPVLGNLHLKTDKTKLIVNATNLEVSVSISVGAQVTEEGEITVPAKNFAEVISNLPKKSVELSLDKEQLKVSSENFSSSFAAMNASDFPKVPGSVPENAILLPKEGFVHGLSKILFSVSTDESRPVLTGVLFIFKPGELTLVSTDGFRLSRKKISLPESKEEFQVIIPRNILTEVLKLSGDAQSISFSHSQSENQVIFSVPDITISSRIVDGTFPPFERIIPSESALHANVDREEFFRSVKLSSVFARDNANVIKLKFNESEIEILSESKTAGSQKSQVPAKLTGKVEEGAIAFNFRFVEEVLGVLEADDVAMGFTGSDTAGVFLDPKDKDYLHLIMPVKVQS